MDSVACRPRSLRSFPAVLPAATAGLFLAAVLVARLPQGLLDEFFRGWLGPVAVALATSLGLRSRRPWALSLSLLGALSLTGLPLLWVWSVRTMWHGPYVFAGLLPNLDAAIYYGCAQDLLRGEPIAPTVFDRPLYLGFLAPLLAVTGFHLKIILALSSVFNGACLWRAARVVSAYGGAVAAGVLLLLIHFIYRITAGTLMTEQLALGLGLLAVAELLRGWMEKERRSQMAGLLWLALALQTRPAAMFMLPSLWLVLSLDGWRAGPWGALGRRAALLALPIVAATLFNGAMKAVFFQPNPTQNVWNVAHALVHGRDSWFNTVQETKGDWRAAREATLAKIKEDPLCLLRASVRSYRQTFSQAQFWRFNGWGAGFHLWSCLAVAGLVFPGFGPRMRRWWALNLTVWAGFLASVTFASNAITGFRIYAAGAPLQMLLVGHAAWQVLQAARLVLVRWPHPLAWGAALAAAGAGVIGVESISSSLGGWFGLGGGIFLGAALFLCRARLSEGNPAAAGEACPPLGWACQAALLGWLGLAPLMAFAVGRARLWPEAIARLVLAGREKPALVPAGAQVHFVDQVAGIRAPFFSKRACPDNPVRGPDSPHATVVLSVPGAFSVGYRDRSSLCAFSGTPGRDFVAGEQRRAGEWEGVELYLDASLQARAKVSPVVRSQP